MANFMHKDGDHIEVDGVTYIPVKKAAMLADYTADYVGQLCRGGKLQATRIGRAWYVSEESIIAHKEGQLVEEKKEEQEFNIKEAVQKAKKERITARNIFRDSSFVVYHKDNRPLMPIFMTKAPEVILEPVEEKVEVKEERPVVEPVVKEVKVQKESYVGAVLSAVARALLGATSFAIVFLLIFSLNGSYTGKLITNAVAKTVANVSATEVGGTIDSDIFEPYRRSAKEFSIIIDDSVGLIFYGDIGKR